MRKIIFFELNEVPQRILEEYCRWRPQSNFARLLPGLHKYETVAEEGVEDNKLSPWMTWPSLHRGVNKDKHKILDFGQDLSEADEEYPSLWSLLAAKGVKTGVCGSLHTYPLPKNVENYSFYLPDTFAAGSECFPEKLSVFQEFNLTMARASGRNVSTKVPWKAAMSLLAAVPDLGLKASTFADLGGQLLQERITPNLKVRRRTYQSVLAFDVFMKYLNDTKPDFATFFTNHVASSMHRYWAAAFPSDYEVFGYDEDWIKSFDKEIRFAMDKADAFFGRMVEFVNRNPEYTIWITSSMGQAAVDAKPVHAQLYVTSPSAFMAAMGFTTADWKPMPSMLPQYNVRLNADRAAAFRDSIGKLRVNGKGINFREADGFFSLDFGQYDYDGKTEFHVTWGGDEYASAQFGLSTVAIEDLSGSSAYHIAQGCFMVHDPKDQKSKVRDTSISALEIAPAILANFGLQAPSYMKRAPKLQFQT